MPSKHDYDARLMTGALVLSLLLHALLLFADRVHFGSAREPARRTVVLQATLQPLPRELSAPPEPAPASRGHAARPTAGPRAAPAAPGSGAGQGREPEKKAREAEPERQAREAFVVQDPGAPEYPDDAVRRKLESCVLAAVLVSASGEVESVRILHADIAGVFDRSVIDAFGRARYRPAQRNGESVPSRVLAVASFELAPERLRRCAGRYAAAARRINAMPLAAPVGPALVESLLHAAP